MVAENETVRKEKYTCECGTRVTVGYASQHSVGPRHQEFLGNPVEPLAPDLQAIVDSKDSPSLRAKMTRHTFSARGWPNAEHPGTVVEFLQEHEIPFRIFDHPENAAERKQRIVAFEREVMYG